MNKEVDSSKQFNVNQAFKNIVNYEEMFVVQTDDNKLEIHANPEVQDAIQVISIVQHINQLNDQEGTVDSLYILDNKGNYRPSNTTLHKLLSTLCHTINLDEKYDVPEINAFVEAVKKHVPQHQLTYLQEPIFWSMSQNTPINSQRIGLVKANFLVKLVDEILLQIQKPAYKQAVQNRLERSQNQFQKGMKLINELFEVYCKLLIIRVDFALKADSNLSLSDLKNMMRFFLKKVLVNKGELKGIEGYIWKLEYGVQKGYHYHCIFFMDGSKHSKDSYYAQKLGELWKRVTDDQGIFHNCNKSKFKYRRLAIGPISHDNEEARQNLEIVMSYLSKTDQFLMEKTFKKYRVFGTSTRKIEKSQSGRPRDNLKN
jgi:hypothetical protein